MIKTARTKEGSCEIRITAVQSPSQLPGIGTSYKSSSSTLAVSESVSAPEHGVRARGAGNLTLAVTIRRRRAGRRTAMPPLTSASKPEAPTAARCREPSLMQSVTCLQDVWFSFSVVANSVVRAGIRGDRKSLVCLLLQLLEAFIGCTLYNNRYKNRQSSTKI